MITHKRKRTAGHASPQSMTGLEHTLVHTHTHSGHTDQPSMNARNSAAAFQLHQWIEHFALTASCLHATARFLNPHSHQTHLQTSHARLTLILNPITASR